MSNRPLLATAALLCLSGTVAAAQPTAAGNQCLQLSAKPLAGNNLELAAADLDGDDRDDLVVGTPLEAYPEFEAGSGHGAVRTFERSPAGTWTQGDGVAGGAGMHRGEALATGDFDGDLLDEYAVSSPDDGGGTVMVREPCGAGCFNILGIVLAQGTNNISGSSEAGDRFGAVLAAADFDDDGYDDLAVGVPAESWADASGTQQGAVHVFYGSPTGLDGARDLLFGQDSFSGQTRESGDRFGAALAAGDLDGDGYADLVIGVPDEDVGAVVDAGVVHVVFGGASGLDFTRRQNWSQTSAGGASAPGTGELFGYSLAVGDFDKASLVAIERRDLAISAPCEPDGALACAGALHVLYSDSNGPSATGALFLRRPGGSVEDGAFGTTLRAGRLDPGPQYDLLVGSPGPAYATPPGLAASGEVHHFYGLKGGALRDSGLEPWRPIGLACAGLGVAANKFGQALALGDFNDDGRADVAIGIPGWSHSVQDQALGAVQLLFGQSALFTDGFDTGDSGRWSATAP